MAAAFALALAASATTLFAAGPLDAELDLRLAESTARLGLKPLAAPKPRSQALYSLGEKLFFEPALSGGGRVSCATCHDPNRATGDGLPLAPALDGPGVLPRHTPPLYNVGQTGQSAYFWDGRLEFLPWSRVFVTEEPRLNGLNPERADYARVLSDGLAMQAMFPVLNPAEMLGAPGTNPVADLRDRFAIWEALTARLLARPGYRARFGRAYPGAKAFNFAHAAEAIAEFERVRFAAVDTPFDRWLGGRRDAMTAAEKRGALLFFGDARCSSCHNSPTLAADAPIPAGYPQIGPGRAADGDDAGAGGLPGQEHRRYQFRSPGLRNVALTGPWGHAGAFGSLEALVEHYEDVGRSLARYEYRNPTVDPRLDLAVERSRNEARRQALSYTPLAEPAALTPAQRADLVQFLRTGLTEIPRRSGR